MYQPLLLLSRVGCLLFSKLCSPEYLDYMLKQVPFDAVFCAGQPTVLIQFGVLNDLIPSLGADAGEFDFDVDTGFAVMSPSPLLAQVNVMMN